MIRKSRYWYNLDFGLKIMTPEFMILVQSGFLKIMFIKFDLRSKNQYRHYVNHFVSTQKLKKKNIEIIFL